MKIFIFADTGTFCQHPMSEEALAGVLDFNRDPHLQEMYTGEIILPELFTAAEKQRLVDQYVEEISDIGDLNHYSLSWLCHPISEKNDLAPDNLFNQVKDFIYFFQVCQGISESGGETLVVLADSPVLVKSIIDFSRKQSFHCEVIGALAPVLKRIFSTGIRWRLSCIRNHYKLLKGKRSRARHRDSLPDKPDKRKIYTVMRTWFDHRSPSLIIADKDVYYGKLPGFLKKKGQDILYFGDIIEAGFGPTFEVPGQGLRNPLLLEGALLNWFDIGKGLWFHWCCKKNIYLKDKIMIQNLDVRHVFENYLLMELKSLYIPINYFTFLAARRLVKKIKVDRFFNLFENYAWEKVTILALRKSSPTIKITSFQHAQVAPGSIKFFMGTRESRGIHLPDRIVTLGQVTRDFLVKEKNYPPGITIPGCALRHDYHYSREKVPRHHRSHILVYLWTFQRSVEMLNFLSTCRGVRERYSITVSTHPNHPLEKLKPHLNFMDTGIFKVSTASLESNFKEADMVVYSGTTVCLDALANGLPVINIEFQDFISPDPLFNFTGFKWNAANEQELLAAVEAIYGLSDTDYYERQKQAQDFVRKYFYPVNEKNMEVFLGN
jgi:hypothetical protein